MQLNGVMTFECDNEQVITIAVLNTNDDNTRDMLEDEKTTLPNVENNNQ